MHHQRGFADAQARAAIGLGHGNAQPARRGQRLVEVLGKAAFLFLAQPVVGIEGRADTLNGVADLLLVGGQCEIHAADPVAAAWPGRITLSGDSP
ncbi:hypothetical protein D3C86_1962510 [compost metagenome]